MKRRNEEREADNMNRRSIIKADSRPAWLLLLSRDGNPEVAILLRPRRKRGEIGEVLLAIKEGESLSVESTSPAFETLAVPSSKEDDFVLVWFERISERTVEIRTRQNNERTKIRRDNPERLAWVVPPTKGRVRRELKGAMALLGHVAASLELLDEEKRWFVSVAGESEKRNRFAGGFAGQLEAAKDFAVEHLTRLAEGSWMTVDFTNSEIDLGVLARARKELFE